MKILLTVIDFGLVLAESVLGALLFKKLWSGQLTGDAALIALTVLVLIAINFQSLSLQFYSTLKQLKEKYPVKR